MQTPTAKFNSHLSPDQLWQDSFITRLYSSQNNRGPFFYPESPYSLGDIATMPSMSPITEETLFARPPQQGLIATSYAPIGSAGFPTFRASLPPASGTVLGPAGTTVPRFTPFGVTDLSYTSPYGLAGLGDDPSPASSLSVSSQSGQSAGPIAYTNPWPTMIQPAPLAGAASPSPMCQFGTWVQGNPLLAALGVGALYLALKKKKGGGR